MIDPAVFRALVAQGATPEMLLAVVEADAAVREEKAAKKRADTAARVRKHRAKDKPSNECNALQSVTERYVSDDLPPNDIYSNPPTNPTGAKAPAFPFSEKVVEAWNAGPAARGATKARKLDTGRKRDLARRVKEHGEDGVLLAIRGIELSDFHCGIGANAFTANLGWLLKNAEKFVAAMERAEAAPTSASPTGKSWSPDEMRAYRESLANAPHLRGNATIDTPRGAGPPRSFAALAGGIASQVTVQ